MVEVQILVSDTRVASDPPLFLASGFWKAVVVDPHEGYAAVPCNRVYGFVGQDIVNGDEPIEKSKPVEHDDVVAILEIDCICPLPQISS